MHRITLRFLVGALGFAAIASCTESPVPDQFPDDIATDSDASGDLPAWIKSTPFRAPVPCPPSERAETPMAPFFTFNQNAYPLTCLVDGPHHWRGHPWFVQRMTGLGDPQKDVIRVCSKGAVKATPQLASPCGELAGPGGCKICKIVEP